MSADTELLAEFLAESRENLDRLENELLSFEGGGGSPAMLAAIFRTAHTVKGNAGFFSFTKLQHVMHTAENLLSRMRDGEIVLTSPIVSTLLDTVDAARELLKGIEATGVEPDDDCRALIDALVRLGGSEPGSAEPASEPEPEPVAAPDISVAPMPAPVAVALAPPPAPEKSPERAPEAAKADPNVRVDTAILDRLVDLAGELVLARNQLLQLAGRGAEPALVRAISRIDTVTSDLQGSVMRTRMQPIGGAWARLPRVVRDLAGELGKRVRLELEGQDTALDRTILEAIKDPLTHLVRNAIDHGIESPERRAAAGKPAEGTLALRASHAGGHVAVEIIDDGAGIDADRVRRRAIERGILTEERAARMTEAELVMLIFAPGFSTAEAVTSVSGRGVGMDVVKTNVEAIGGTVTVIGRRGLGTTVRITIPLTLAIMPTLLVAARDQRFALPEAALVEVLRVEPDPERGELGVEYIHGAPIYRRRGEQIPLIVLGDLLAGQVRSTVVMPAYIAVVASDGGKLGIVVDELHDSEEVVVKPLSRLVADVPFFSGATVLGDGHVALIIDVQGVATAVGLHGTRGTHAPVLEAAVTAGSAPSYLIVRASDRRLAIPLAEVCRLENFPVASFERAGRFEVVQYHGKLLPLLRLGDPSGARATVIVHAATGRDLGLVVESIVDTYEGELALDTATAGAGTRGSAVIAGHTVDVIDVGTFAADAGLVTERAA